MNGSILQDGEIKVVSGSINDLLEWHFSGVQTHVIFQVEHIGVGFSTQMTFRFVVFVCYMLV